MKIDGLVMELLEQQEFKQWVLKPNPESDYFWETWMSKSPDRRKAALSAREIILRVKFTKYELEEAWKTSLLDDIIQGHGEHYKKEPAVQIGNYWRVAAAIAILLVSGWIWSEYQTVIEQPAVSETVDPEFMIRSNPPGQKSKINLPDGSVVNLNANSTLKYRRDFNKDRYLELEGEAFFDVEKDSLFPFRVNSGSVITTALGTSFNIDSDSRLERITLVEGSVKVHETGSNEFEILEPYEEVAYSDEKGLSPKRKLSTIKSVRWMDGILYFDDASLTEVIQTLEDWYAVDIRIEGSPNGLSYSGEFQNEYLSNVLHSMKFSLDIDYEIHDRIVELKIRDL